MERHVDALQVEVQNAAPLPAEFLDYSRGVRAAIAAEGVRQEDVDGARCDIFQHCPIQTPGCGGIGFSDRPDLPLIRGRDAWDAETDRVGWIAGRPDANAHRVRRIHGPDPESRARDDFDRFGVGTRRHRRNQDEKSDPHGKLQVVTPANENNREVKTSLRFGVSNVKQKASGSLT